MVIFACRDHAGGNEKMRLLVPGIKVYGGSLDNVKGCTDQVENGTKLSVGKEIEILCLHTPWYALLLSCPVT
jgi:hydroxyacylglutathione hydrolase